MKFKWLWLFLVLVVIASAAFFMFNPGKPVAYTSMPGIYKCDEFGLPDKTFDRLQITEEMKLVGHSANKQFSVGRLAPREGDLELEFSMDVVHFSSFGLDPFTAPRIRVYSKFLVLTAKRNDKEFTEKYVRLD